MADEQEARAPGPGSEPVGRTDRDGGVSLPELGVEGLPPGLRERIGVELIDQLLAGARTEEEIEGPGGVRSMTKRLVERAMDAELSEHLGYERGGAPPGGAGNARNGTTPKTLRTDHGPVRVETPRDRQGSFEPQILPKRTTRFAGFDDKIIALYARGISVRDIQAYLGALRRRGRPRPDQPRH
jgi:transposase-like protein